MDLNNLDVAIDLPDNFWRQGRIADFLKREQDSRLDYVESIVSGLEIQQKQLRAEYEEVAGQGELVEYRRKFSRQLAILVGLLAGFTVPLVIFAAMELSHEQKRKL